MNKLFFNIKRKIYKLFHPQWGEILMLHRIVPAYNPQSKNAHLEITPEFLEQTIVKYQKKGYLCVTLEQVKEQVLKGKHFHKKFVCFTFDDGFADNFELAYPIFKTHNCPFTIFVTVGFLDNFATANWYKEQPKMLSMEQLTKLSNEPLCTIGSHTLTHPHLTELDFEAQKREILLSKQILEQWTGKPITHFAYPYGDYNEQLMQIVESCGYQTAVLCNGNYVRRGQSVFALKRKILSMNSH
ncbi:MAG: polysaccharide deacetylase family protein [Prevotellaceae bacterium]|jgi:peptidoglycan/xylan/chitin deacetylase (PgdA/CDA1 family)|nr:polysaccharide deacetylase family protein [Prevotellaceae bacterium]